MSKKLIIHNGKIITPSRIIPSGSLLITDGLITAISEYEIQVSDAERIDAKGKYIAPGFIDIHIHGGGGHDFMDGTATAFIAIAATHLKYGTTAMMPTTLTSTRNNLLDTLKVYEDISKKEIPGAQFTGMHLEGPYFAMNQKGAQDPRYIKNPDPAEYKEILAKTSCIKRWSAAPELEGALEFGRYMLKNGILPALAHTDAIYEEVLEGFDNGFTLATHLYSAMTGVNRRNGLRYAGAVEAAYLIDEMDVELIADGVHLPPALLKLAYKIKGPDRIALITDAMRGAGMPEGDSILGSLENGIKVIIEDGVAKLPDRSAFAGSVATADRLVRNMIQLADVSMVDAVKMMTATPARIIGIDKQKGSLVVGKAADIVIFDESINIDKTIIAGKVLYAI